MQDSSLSTGISNTMVVKKSARRKKWEKIKSQRQLMLMSVPLLIYIIIFHYIPLYGWLMAFQRYRPSPTATIFNQEWVGLEQFKFLFKGANFGRVLRNTVAMSLINLVLSFVTAIALALLLNEIKNLFVKKVVQTISYLPYFLSWVIAATMVSQALLNNGIVNEILLALRIIDQPKLWLAEGKHFWTIFGVANVWKNVGFNAIVYLGAMAAIDPHLYEAAEIDGAGRFKKMRYITLPGIKSTFMVLLIMNVAHLLSAGTGGSGFEFQLLLQRPGNIAWSETIDVFAIRYGIRQSNFSLATAAGMFKTVVSIFLVFSVNAIAKKLGEERLI
ncbi:ABC transporter permease [Acetivibrio saccincola]|uniref:Putative multiple-sugar transport system permease YteP n=1 Tax=Acetivibrio saccincola TaxID=1677857 RepID=A0A2K9DY40_9FIRM|nr:putative multiple-sugar transport system permease YteP [Acetivibrio saccincola]